LKALERGADERPVLTPFQRSLVVTLKSVREQLDDNGSISEAFVHDWLKRHSVTVRGLLSELERIREIGKTLRG
jgi:hypothetical protein